MRKPNNWLAALFTVVMLLSTIPGAAFATETDEGGAPPEDEVSSPVDTPSEEAEVSPPADIPSEEDESQQENVPADGETAAPITDPEMIGNDSYTISNDSVIFNTSYMDIEVGYDVEKAEQGETPYALFAEDGSYTIELYEEAPFFPYEVQFTYQGQTTTEWFMDENDSVVVGGHTFYVACMGGVPEHLSLEISGEYVPAYPEHKIFVNDPEYGIMPASLLPLKEVELNVDLTKYLPAELKEVGVDVVLKGQTVSDGSAVVWAKGYSNDDFTIADKTTKLDLTPEYSGSSWSNLELIVGSDDQLDKNNIRYIVEVKVCPLSDVLTFSAFTEAGEALEVYDQYCSGDADGKQRYQLNIGEGKWTEGSARISMGLNSQFPDHNSLRVVVYEGYYRSVETLPSAGIEVTNIWKTTGTDAHLADYSNWRNLPEFTVVLYRGDEVAQILPFGLYMYLGSFRLQPGSGLYAEAESQYQTYRPRVSNHQRYDGSNTYLYTMGSGYLANGSYYFNLWLVSPDPEDTGGENGIEFVDASYVGIFKTKAEAGAAGAKDITSELFSDAEQDGGYKADFSQGVTFTVFTKNDKVLSVTVKAVEDTKLPDAPGPLSADTYFRMRTAYKLEGKSQYNYYVMPYGNDSYYYNGYQTVFLLDGTSAIPDGTTIYPVFYQGNKVDVHLGHDNESTVKQESGKSSISFKSGDAIHYSAAAENGTHLKNYWVTFLTKQSGGAKLFVNGATNADPSHCDTDGTPIREVFLDDAHGNHHDVFFANIGDAELTELYVKLENAQSIKLDDYWTVREDAQSTSLAAFDTTEHKMTDNSNDVSEGELKNVAKVRLLPDGAGTISGTLIIGSTGTKEEVRIKLTGTAGVPKITTTTLVDGVKYVPYSSVIQTNNMYASDAIKFELVAGALPGGMIVKPNGEVYGVPQAAGEFTFTVRATYNNDPTLYDEKEFTLKIVENTDTNVYTATDSGYDVTEHIGEDQGGYHFVLNGYKTQTFKTEGELGDFIDLWLDGRKLTKGVDYQAESGSTVITIYGETLDGNDDGSGKTHTIAAEFREGDKDDGTLKRAAQNYVIEGVSSKPSNPGPSNPGTNNPRPSNPGSSGGSSSSGNKNPGNTKPSTDDSKKDETPTPVPEVPKGLYSDVLEQNWFYDDVKWAKENEIMVGVTETTFAPNEAISQATIVTVLARLLKIDLTQFDGVSYDDVTPGQWYTNAAIWAKQSGILPDYSSFTGTAELSRDGMAIMLVKFLRSMGVDTNVDVSGITFADAEQMTDAGREAFQILYHYGIFRGIGENRMDPLSSVTRAQFAALMHRISVFIESK